MLDARSSIVLGSALIATLTLSPGFTAEALTIPSQATTEGPAVSVRLDPCDAKGHGCAPGRRHGHADGVRCLPANPHGYPESGYPDFGFGYDLGYTEGRKQANCGGSGGQGQGQGRKAQLRSQGRAQGLADAQNLERCVRANLRGMPKPFKRGYRSANPYC